jgi:hypothetical protein
MSVVKATQVRQNHTIFQAVDHRSQLTYAASLRWRRNPDHGGKQLTNDVL